MNQGQQFAEIHPADEFGGEAQQIGDGITDIVVGARLEIPLKENIPGVFQHLIEPLLALQKRLLGLTALLEQSIQFSFDQGDGIEHRTKRMGVIDRVGTGNTVPFPVDITDELKQLVNNRSRVFDEGFSRRRIIFYSS